MFTMLALLKPAAWVYDVNQNQMVDSATATFPPAQP